MKEKDRHNEIKRLQARIMEGKWRFGSWEEAHDKRVITLDLLVHADEKIVVQHEQEIGSDLIA